jgi:hypothetical protein
MDRLEVEVSLQYSSISKPSRHVSLPNLEALLPKSILISEEYDGLVPATLALAALQAQRYTAAEGIAFLTMKCCGNGRCGLCTQVDDLLNLNGGAFQLELAPASGVAQGLYFLREGSHLPQVLRSQYEQQQKTDGANAFIVLLKFNPQATAGGHLHLSKTLLSASQSSIGNFRDILSLGNNTVDAITASQTSLKVAMPLLQNVVMPYLLLSQFGSEKGVILPASYCQLSRALITVGLPVAKRGYFFAELMRSISTKILRYLVQVTDSGLESSPAVIDEAVLLVLTMAANAQAILRPSDLQLVQAVVQQTLTLTSARFEGPLQELLQDTTSENILKVMANYSDRSAYTSSTAIQPLAFWKMDPRSGRPTKAASFPQPDHLADWHGFGPNFTHVMDDTVLDRTPTRALAPPVDRSRSTGAVSVVVGMTSAGLPASEDATGVAAPPRQQSMPAVDVADTKPESNEMAGDLGEFDLITSDRCHICGIKIGAEQSVPDDSMDFDVAAIVPEEGDASQAIEEHSKDPSHVQKRKEYGLFEVTVFPTCERRW